MPKSRELQRVLPAVSRLVALACAIVGPLLGQELRGTIRDSTSRQPIPGAVLQLLDSAGAGLTRSSTNERGEYRLSLAAAGRRVRVVRLGFRPRLVPLPAMVNGTGRLDLMMESLPTFLDATRVVSDLCPRRSDQGAAANLLEQARAGLLTSVVARETNPPRLVRYAYERTMDGTSDRIKYQMVRVDSTDRTSASFNAALTATAFVQRGFAETGAGGTTYYAPDAETLLGDTFVNAYCFSLKSRDRRRPNQMGLAFAAATHFRWREDIDGALWVDTAKRSLRDIEFLFVGADGRPRNYEPGGRVQFLEFSNGVVLVDRWNLRLVSTRLDDTWIPEPSVRRMPGQLPVRSDRPSDHYLYNVHESGGELARASWPGGLTWRTPLSTVRARALTPTGTPASGQKLYLVGTHETAAATAMDDSLIATPYRAVTDSAGSFEITEIVPGPYSVVVAEPRLAPLKLNLVASMKFTATRDSVHRAQFTMPTVDDFVSKRCAADKRLESGDAAWVLARMINSDGRPIGGVEYRVNKQDADSSSYQQELISKNGKTGTDGFFQLCTRRLKVSDQLHIIAWKGADTVKVSSKLVEKVTIIPIVMKARP